MGIKNRGSINIFVLTLAMVLLMGVTLWLYQISRISRANQLFLHNNQAMQFGIALEMEFMSEYQHIETGIFCGKKDDYRYYVKLDKGDVINIFIVVEYMEAIFTTDITLDHEGNLLERLDNVPKGEITCW